MHLVINAFIKFIGYFKSLGAEFINTFKNDIRSKLALPPDVGLGVAVIDGAVQLENTKH